MAGDPVPANGEVLNTDAASWLLSSDTQRVSYQPLVVVLLAVALGMVADRYLQLSSQIAESSWFVGHNTCIACWLLGATSLTAWFWAWRKQYTRTAGWLVLASAALAGAAWHHLNWFDFGADELARYATYDPRPSCIDVVACESAERVAAPPRNPLRASPTGEHSRLIVSVTGIRDGKTWRPASGTCQLSVQGHALWIHPGDQLRIFGKLARPSPTLNPGEFDFAAHARADRVLTRVRAATPDSIVRLAVGSRWSPQYIVDAARGRAKQLVRTLVGPTRAGLAAAILLGAREGLPYEETEPYMETGTIHVWAVRRLPDAANSSGRVL
jgi:hypothetical protein